VNESQALNLTDAVMLVQAAVVVGGGFFFVGRLGAKMDNLSKTIDTLKQELHNSMSILHSLERRMAVIESRISREERAGLAADANA
jgi:hypothetical protein